MNNLTRDVDYILKNLYVSNKGQIITKKKCTFQVPEHLKDKKLLDIGKETKLIGFFCIIMEDKYAVMSMTAKVLLGHYQLQREKVEGVEYLNFNFEEGSVVIENTEVFKDDSVLYFLVSEFILNGKIPWYMEYDDVGKILITSKEYTGQDLLACEQVGEIIASMLTRCRNDRSKYWRLSDMKEKPVFIPISNVFYGPTNTTNKLCGSYFSDGVISSLVTPTETLENIEAVLRV